MKDRFNLLNVWVRYRFWMSLGPLLSRPWLYPRADGSWL